MLPPMNDSRVSAAMETVGTDSCDQQQYLQKNSVAPQEKDEVKRPGVLGTTDSSQESVAITTPTLLSSRLSSDGSGDHDNNKKKSFIDGEFHEDNNNNNSDMKQVAYGAGLQVTGPPQPVSKTDATNHFRVTVEDAVAKLTKSHGYSRNHATEALLQEIVTISNADVDDNDCLNGQLATNNDPQVDEAMRRHSLGITQATQALTVSKSIARIASRRRIPTFEAVGQLTAQISKSKLVQYGRPTSPPSLQHSTEQLQRPQPAFAASSTLVGARPKIAAAAEAAVAVVSTGMSRKQKARSRKRSHDDTVTPSENKNASLALASSSPNLLADQSSPISSSSRGRSDSVAEVVAAKKLAAAASGVESTADSNKMVAASANEANNTSSTATAPCVLQPRVKRSRVVELPTAAAAVVSDAAGSVVVNAQPSLATSNKRVRSNSF